MKKIVVISGGPNSGKTTVINMLKDRSYSVFVETAGEIIQEELAKVDCGVLPWDSKEDSIEFHKKIVVRQLNLYSNLKDDLCFLDRSVVDTLGYIDLYDLGIEVEKSKIPEFYRVYFFETLDFENYDKNQARQEDYKEALIISNRIYKKYLEYGFDVKILSKNLTAEKRMNLILKDLYL